MKLQSKTLVFFWATLMLVSSTCFGADVHYCEGEAQTFGIFEQAKPCKMHKKQKVEKKVHKCCMARKKKEIQPREGTPILKNGKCCYNDQVSFKSDADPSSFSADVQLNAKEQSKAIEQTQVDAHWMFQNKSEASFRGPPDPELTSNYQVFFQVFRI